MAIDTTNEKLALLEWDLIWEPAIPLSPGAFTQADQQQMIWGYPGLLWEPLGTGDATLIDSAIYNATLTDAAVNGAAITDTEIYGAAPTDSGIHGATITDTAVHNATVTAVSV